MSVATAQQVVTFRLADDYFAADIFAVERVLRYTRPTAVPNLPEWIEGVIEYQGRVVPVIDLRRRFGLEANTGAQSAMRVMVFVVGTDWIGAVVDAVLEVVTLTPDQIAPPPAIFRGLSAEYLRGLVRREGRLLIYLEVERLLTSTERIVLERVVQELGAPAGQSLGTPEAPERGKPEGRSGKGKGGKRDG